MGTFTGYSEKDVAILGGRPDVNEEIRRKGLEYLRRIMWEFGCEGDPISKGQR